MNAPGTEELRRELEAIFRRFNRAEFVDPDPLGPVLHFADPRDQEVVGLITSSLAFGNVKTILASAAVVLRALPVAPRDLAHVDPRVLRARLRGFRHRYVAEKEMSAMLLGAADAMRAQGSLAAAFETEWRASGGRFEEALGGFSRRLRGEGGPGNYLLPDPASGSACKRWMMYLRWMARCDAVDPGAWRALGASLRPRHLLVPVDTHMLRIATALGFTRRNQGSLLTAREITARFAVVAPRDPVRYDFALTRLGIRRAPEMAELLARWSAQAERNSTP
ncbi:MAG: hypothetical protein RLZZ303_2112 [Candidatus Hydrogenedentota bacterium]|jgi:uncharacterized protein (TIGR02757 family)